MWQAIRSFVSNPTVQGILITVAVALVEALLTDSEPEPTDSQ